MRTVGIHTLDYVRRSLRAMISETVNAQGYNGRGLRKFSIWGEKTQGGPSTAWVSKVAGW